jgi:lipopolysaccharide/colanic/teichoic acid biosynthesis glycosyltransferase
VIKRIIDIVIALIGLVFLSPLVMAIALLIKLDSPGPALFLQTRIGRGGRPFHIFKFRTMQHKLDDGHHKAFMRAFVRGEIGQSKEKRLYKPFTETQVTRMGRMLRKTSLDELPQLINILKGEMSLVGPRPNVVYEVEEYSNWHRRRLEVLPGITGLAQVNGRSALNFDAIVKYDIEYIRRQSLWLDLNILWQTFATVLKKQGAE